MSPLLYIFLYLSLPYFFSPFLFDTIILLTHLLIRKYIKYHTLLYLHYNCGSLIFNFFLLLLNFFLISISLCQCHRHLSPVCMDFMRRLLVKDPNMRMSTGQALRHPFITGQVSDIIYYNDVMLYTLILYNIM